MNRVLLILFLISLSFKCISQNDTLIEDEKAYKPPVPVELMIGNEALYFKMVVTKPIYNSKFKFYNLMNFTSNFIDGTASNIFNQTVLFYDLSTKFSVGFGSNYSSFSSLKPVVSALYSDFNAKRGFIIQPTLVLEKKGAKELFSMYEFSYVLNPKFKGYFRFDAFTSWEEQHDFSYLNGRVGVGTRFGNFGPALNISFVGKGALKYYNIGAFYNILI